MKFWRIVLTGLFLLGLPAVVQAQFTTTTNNGVITITGYTGTSGDVIIPDTINGDPVTSIEGFFSATSLTNITIPDSVTNIATGVFDFQSSLTAILVDEKNSNYSSFNGVLFDKNQTFLIQAPGGMTGSYTIPASVISIGDEAFENCGGFTNLTLGTNIVSIGDDAFYDCSGLTGFLIPNSVTNLGNEAFENCGNLTNITIGTGVTTIGSDAFAFCSDLTGITIPRSVTNIVAASSGILRVGGGTQLVNGPVEMVANCSRLTAITVDEQNPFYSSTNGILFNKPQTILFEAPGALAGSYAISSSVTSIGAEAFQNCGKLTSIFIPSTVTNIGTAALAACGSLAAMAVDGQNKFYSSTNGILFDQTQTTLIQFPGGIGGSYAVANGITGLGSAAFSGCSNLSSITIPASVTNVGNATFANCSHAGIYFEGNAPGITSSGPGLISGPGIPIFGNNFYNPNAEAVYYLPGTTGWGATFDGEPAYLWVPPFVCTPASNSITINGYNGSGSAITIPDMINGLPVTSIASGAFDNANSSGLTNITLGAHVATIGSYAFAACANLTSITIPNGVTNVGSGAFAFCDNLYNVYFQGNAPSAGSSVFFHWPSVFPPVYEPPTPTTVYYLPGTTGWGTTFGGQPTALWNPQAQTSGASFGVSANGFGFNITGASNLTVVVEAATNLSSPDWQPVQTNTLTSGSVYFSDPQWTNYPGRFYRLRLP